MKHHARTQQGRTCWGGTVLTALFVVAVFVAPVSAASFIVEDGEPNAEIVITANPPRSVRLASWELQNYVRKLSGATLPIVHEPGDAAVQVYIGESAHTEKLGVTDEGLEYGAYRIVSGDGWLALIGQDTDFEPVEPYTRKRSQRGSEAMMQAWDDIAGGYKWGHPMANAFKMRMRNVQRHFRDEGAKEEPFYLWIFDERGSYNAVCGFLRRLGVRWYMPGELGEIVPRRDSIPLPDINERVEPAFAVRTATVAVGVHDPRVSIWLMRLGMRQPHGVVGAHGLNAITGRKEIKQTHPEYFLLRGGERAARKQCLSNPQLFRSTVAYARTVVDHYHTKFVSLMPADGYTTLCQCSLCEGKDSPDRPYTGRLSNHVWGFTARVANELARTHPHAGVSNVAYNVYKLPPTDIEKLPDNVLVGIKNGRGIKALKNSTGPLEIDRVWADHIALRQAWLEKSDRRLLNYESYLNNWVPAFFTQANARSINAIKGDFLGERILISSRFAGRLEDAAYYSHLCYFTFRMYWGDENQDIAPMLAEFYTLFYGPARSQMKAFYEYCEAHVTEMKEDKAKADRALALFAEAREQVEEGSIYDKRLAVLGEFLDKLADRSEQLAREQKRENVPKVNMVRGAQRVEVDGRLDDEFWRTIPRGRRGGSLRDLQTGNEPKFGTSFKVAWGRDAIYFAIRCEDLPGREVKVGADRDGDPGIWNGDVVEIHLETEQHSYYQIAISPTGAVVDLDRAGGKKDFRWDSQAEVVTQRNVEEGYWTIEARIPVIDSSDDPYHQVVGTLPKDLPWYFNVCRKRAGENSREASAFSPTGKMAFHVPSRFARLYQD